MVMKQKSLLHGGNCSARQSSSVLLTYNACLAELFCTGFGINACEWGIILSLKNTKKSNIHSLIIHVHAENARHA